MKIANIYPIANQEGYQDEEYVMILAHLVKQGLYDKKYFTGNKYIIMDNGLFEKQQVSTDVRDCISLAENSGIQVSEIIVPDAVNNIKETIKLFEENKEAIAEWQAKYKFMFVAQAKSYLDLLKGILYANKMYKKYNISVGISKLTPLKRDSFLSRCTYRLCKPEIHFLGIKESFCELTKVKTMIRGCDSSQLAFIAKNVPDCFEMDIAKLLTYTRKGEDIDLAKDKCNASALSYLKVIFKKGVKQWGFMMK